MRSEICAALSISSRFAKNLARVITTSQDIVLVVVNSIAKRVSRLLKQTQFRYGGRLVSPPLANDCREPGIGDAAEQRGKQSCNQKRNGQTGTDT